MDHNVKHDRDIRALHHSSRNAKELAAFNQNSSVDVTLGKVTNMSPEMQLKQFLHDTRKALNISQRELSKMSGVNQSNLSKIENGIINPSIATIQKVASCLGHKVELRFIPNFKE